MKVQDTGITDSIFHLLFLETVNYILSKKLDKKQKQVELEEIGYHMGERISNHLLNLSNNRVKEITDILIFLGKEVWTFVFSKKIFKLQTNKKGTYLIDIEDFRFLNGLFTEKTISTANQETIELILYSICGIIKGTLSVFNLDCIVTPTFKPQVIINNLLSNMANISNVTVAPYSFTINLLNI